MDTKQKGVSIESIFPILTTEDNIIFSKRGDVTYCFELYLPEPFILNETEYDDIINTFTSAIKILKEYTIVHRQEVFRKRTYEMEPSKSYLGGCYERHFKGREYMVHSSYLFLTFSNESNVKAGETGSSIFGNLACNVPTQEFLESCKDTASRFESIIGNCRFINIRSLENREIIGDEREKGIIFRHLNFCGSNVISDFEIKPDRVKSSDKSMFAYVISDIDRISSTVSSVRPIQKLSTPRSTVLSSYGYLLGGALKCEHIINFYYTVLPQAQIFRDLERKKKQMMSLSKVSQDNKVFSSEIESFQEQSAKEQMTIINFHADLLFWCKDDELQKFKNEVVLKFTELDIEAIEDTYNVPCLFIASLPGAESELSFNEYMKMEIESALCFMLNESYNRSIEGGKIKLCDRQRMIPLHLDISDAAYRQNLIYNYNAFALGGSGAGKSFFINKIVRDLYDSGSTIFIMDKGASYEALCSIIKEESEGKDGMYYSYEPERPFSFNPFRNYENWDLSSGEELSFVKAIIQTVWNSKTWSTHESVILESLILDFLEQCRKSEKKNPVFRDFINYLHIDVLPKTKRGEYTVGDIVLTSDMFDIETLLVVCTPFTTGRFSFLLNSEKETDFFTSDFTVFDIDELSKIEEIYPICVLCIIKSFESKMRQDNHHKLMLIDEAWKAMMNPAMSEYIENLWRTSRKYFTTAIVVTQQAEDLLSSPIIKSAILDNSSIKILLDQSSNLMKIDSIIEVLSLNPNDKAMILSINKDIRAGCKYKEVFISFTDKLSGVYSTEVSPQEAIAFETERKKKRPFIELANKIGYINALKELTNDK